VGEESSTAKRNQIGNLASKNDYLHKFQNLADESPIKFKAGNRPRNHATMATSELCDFADESL
jgi:hypothetical protein